MKRAKRNTLPARRRARLELTLDERSASARLPEPALIRRACQAALQRDVKQAQVSIVIVDAAEGQTLNRDYRGKDYATNVLTFALNEGESVPGLPLFGDLVLCAPVVEKEAAEQNKSLEAHYSHLLVHGMLHLQGYDHIEDEEAEIMETLESVIMQRLGYANPYSEEHL